MKIPKIINRDGKKYIFIKQANDNLFLYEEINHKYKECFTSYDLGAIKITKKIKGGMHGWSK